jgi:erythromycin esterase-like protein
MEKSKAGFETWMNNPRDKRMYENILSMYKKRYPGEKIIIWIASYHGAYNPEILVDSSGKAISKGFKSTGSFLKNYFKDNIYSISFTAGGGANGTVYDKSPVELENVYTNSLEDILNQTGLEWLLVPVKGNLFLEARKIYSRTLGYIYHSTFWDKQLDAIIYVRRTTPVSVLKE